MSYEFCLRHSCAHKIFISKFIIGRKELWCGDMLGETFCEKRRTKLGYKFSETIMITEKIYLEIKNTRNKKIEVSGYFNGYYNKS